MSTQNYPGIVNAGMIDDPPAEAPRTEDPKNPATREGSNPTVEYLAALFDSYGRYSERDDVRWLGREIHRLTRELEVQKAVADLAYIPHRNLVESRDRAVAQRDRLRAALEGLMPFCAEDFPENPSNWSRACVSDGYREAFIEANKVLGRG